MTTNNSVKKYDALEVHRLRTAVEAGARVASTFASATRDAIKERGQASVILATGNSQLEFMKAVREMDDIDWTRIVVFHMDEYLGMHATHPASFRRWLAEELLEHVHGARFFPLMAETVPIQEEIRRYSDLLAEADPDLVVMGIGENGHLAFNDPPADFATDALVHLVDLDVACRRQQVGEGHFDTLDEVPKRAVSLTIHALLKPRMVLVLAPERRKAPAVRMALEESVDPQCPASILRTKENALLILDNDSASELTWAEENGTT